MSSLQVRNVPAETLRALKARAAAAGQSLSEFALAELTASVARPSLDELSERIRVRGVVNPQM
ncbi:FitA-like ribbon-helix-helix domain-containing protein [Rathayibacter soli]|uniref:FitA-like ribbon-helix-helix domain-containing protein n=1 Tax=Rathayibacter soli TaxID=3144168 RepID=UPI0027E3F04E|nr:hypothetical protein [Glaciibacter superstes]